MIKPLLIFFGSVAATLIFYIQGAKLELKEKQILKAEKDSFRVALHYKDSIIQLLGKGKVIVNGDTLIKVKNPDKSNLSSSNFAPLPPIVIHNSPTTSNSSTTSPSPITQKLEIPDRLYSKLDEIINKQPITAEPDSPYDSLLLKMKQDFNDSLNYSFAKMCASFIGKDTNSVNLKPYIDKIKTDRDKYTTIMFFVYKKSSYYDKGIGPGVFEKNAIFTTKEWTRLSNTDVGGNNKRMLDDLRTICGFLPGIFFK